MTGWEPATEAEVAMGDALRAQDQQLYFRILTRVDLLLPVAGESPAGRSSVGWGTWTSDGRTHILAFTSVTALRACLGDNAGPTRRVPYAELAAGWPNHEWWLAVNPGLPIEGYLPAWFVAQLFRGDVRLPGRTMGTRARLERVGTAAWVRGAGASDQGVTASPPAAAPTGRPPAASVPPAAVPPASVPPAPIPPAHVAPVPVPHASVSPASVPPAAVSPGSGGRVSAVADEPSTVPISISAARPTVSGATGPAGPPFAPTTDHRGPDRPAPLDRQPGWAARTAFAGGAAGRAESGSDNLSGWLDDLRRRPDEPDPFADNGRTGVANGRSGEPPPPPARSFFEPASGRSSRRPSSLDPAHRAGERAVPPSRLARGGQPFPRRRPLNEPVPEQPARPLGMDSGETTQALHHDAPARPFQPTSAASTEEATQALPRRRPLSADGPGADERTHPTPKDPGNGALRSDEAEELPPSIAEPVSGPPTPQRGFKPIVIEGTVIEARDLTGPEEPPSIRPAVDPMFEAPEPAVSLFEVPAPEAAEPTVSLFEAPAPEPVPADFAPANDVEEELLGAVGSGSTDGFLSTLLLARVLLPVAAGSALESRPGDPGFVWRTEQLDGETYVVVYTSPERLADRVDPPVDTVRVKFVQLIRRWPDESWSFAVNPGTPVGAKYPGEQVLALANWAAEVGLGDDPESEPEPPATEADPVAETRPAAPPVDPSRPVTMQKAIAPSQLAYYLERGYDRVSGFVHRASELAHLSTPAQLYDALGLGHPDSPFGREAEEIYVLRWPAYRPSLYRIPYGGQNEAAMRAMEGWVIERPPFRGNGFAPGESTDVIAEFKVDSARLPHGAELCRIGADGSDRVVAVLDTDTLLWRRVGEP
ncbi:SseB family protein [Micromonospora sp. NPDC048999]|uniref:SseB family protein n=1 Tax=Micromonospora sp. NPDC048999 TaxID=3155391 RepID=UPI0033FD768A